MAEGVDSRCVEIDAEDEGKSADSSHKELEDLEKQSKDDGDTSKHLNSPSACNDSPSEVLESRGNSSCKTNTQGTTERTSNLMENPDVGCSNNSVKTDVKIQQIRIANDQDRLGGKQDVLIKGNDNYFQKTEDWDKELDQQNAQNVPSLQSSCADTIGITEDWDQEIKESGITQPHFILKKGDALNEEVFNIKILKNISDVDLGAVGGGPSPSTGAALQLSANDNMQSLYHIKWVTWKNLNTPIITQNENGPCPLIALMNVLILQRRISIPPVQEMVSSNQLMEYLGDYILTHAPERLTEGAQLNYEQNMADAIGIMCKLQTGLDVNVKFTGVADFEFTRECLVFDLLNIRLLHGWLVDPQNHEAILAIGSLSYNQLVEKIIASKQEGADSNLATEGFVAESFLDNTASQLTYHGLYELNAKMDEEELCIFFRNNHFNTLFKHKNELFLLVTDQGYLTEEKVMWETLSNVEGDGCFVDANLQTIPVSQQPSAEAANAGSKLPTGISQEDQDYLVALSLQEEQTNITNSRGRESWEQEASATANLPPQPDPSAGMTSQEWSDLQLAMQLQQEEEQRNLQLQQQQQQHQQHQSRSQPSDSRPRGSPSHASSNPSPSSQSPRQQTPSDQNKECTIL
ncbi:ubiquitin carboxyl-terminal hydrolase MINDY-1 isoform X2 [Exaiptasia diaphana]|uniref:Ubiquitin carboxyl-terminal hydrolase n=1 Tax=Exaiptasia diaphana TaxID=2652724 RepID=A0A913WUT6_EXADI|nr:ubiquitin carboxyl-terminal hydrolase MINDY-1 isoform X2 [Exaiptasia diaphana]KXJ17639.1 Protein FAM63A [Exaiptasia diaphana]